MYQVRYPYPRTERSVYLRGTLTSGSRRRATLRLGLDGWATVYLNPGDNHLLIKTNNRQNRERHLWAIHCALE